MNPIREAAVLYLAADAMLCEDFAEAEDALIWARRVAHAVDNDPIWANGRHEGDCTKAPMTCSRCVLEELEAEARRKAEE